MTLNATVAVEVLWKGFREAGLDEVWEELSTNEKHSLVAAFRQLAHELEERIAKGSNRL